MEQTPTRERVFITFHIGEFGKVCSEFLSHPTYLSRRWSTKKSLKSYSIGHQHHHRLNFKTVVRGDITKACPLTRRWHVDIWGNQKASTVCHIVVFKETQAVIVKDHDQEELETHIVEPLWEYPLRIWMTREQCSLEQAWITRSQWTYLGSSNETHMLLCGIMKIRSG